MEKDLTEIPELERFIFSTNFSSSDIPQRPTKTRREIVEESLSARSRLPLTKKQKQRRAKERTRRKSNS